MLFYTKGCTTMKYSTIIIVHLGVELAVNAIKCKLLYILYDTFILWDFYNNKKNQ